MTGGQRVALSNEQQLFLYNTSERDAEIALSAHPGRKDLDSENTDGLNESYPQDFTRLEATFSGPTESSSLPVSAVRVNHAE